jgi:hypothetical protein
MIGHDDDSGGPFLRTAAQRAMHGAILVIVVLGTWLLTCLALLFALGAFR